MRGEAKQLAIHWTYEKNFDSIATNGLEPRHSDVSGTAGVYVWTTDDEGCQAGAEFATYRMKAGTPVALVIDVTGLDLEPDDSGLEDCPDDVAKVIREDISPDRILGVEEYSDEEIDDHPMDTWVC